MISDQLIQEPDISASYLKSYRELIVWQKSMDLAQKIYSKTKKFPREETYGLQAQIRRAVVSIPSNIAEGQQRNGKNEFVHFLGIANGSLAEVQTQVILSARLGYLSIKDSEEILSDSEEVSKLLCGLLKALTTGH